MEKTKKFKVRNWIIEFKSGCSGWLIYDGKTIPSWGVGQGFILDKYSARYDYPEVVPNYIKEKLEKIREDMYM